MARLSSADCRLQAAVSVSGGLAERSSNNPSKQIGDEFESTPDRSVVHSCYSELAKLHANLLFPFVGPLIFIPQFVDLQG